MGLTEDCGSRIELVVGDREGRVEESCCAVCGVRCAVCVVTEMRVCEMWNITRSSTICCLAHYLAYMTYNTIQYYFYHDYY